MKIKETLAALNKAPAKKKIQYLAIALIMAVVLLLYFSTLTSDGEKQQQREQVQAEQTTAEIEDKLKVILSKVDGAGEVDVVINYESSSELVPAMSEQSNTSSNQSETTSSETKNENRDIATIKEGGDTSALIIKEIQPVVRGVIIVAEGAGDIGVRLQLLEAVQTFLDVSAEKVEVLKMNHTKS
ncbi:MAG: hypothetical protein DBY39_01885 [Clostridiales bacterium]|nr:MAG: hypothetical protein DBY39_01885 [Clostridiales bacterium]